MKKLFSIMLCAVMMLGIMPNAKAATVQTYAIQPQYDRVGYFHEGLAEVSKNGKWGFIDKSGKEVIALKYDWSDSFSEGLAAVEKDGQWGFIDKTGKEVIALQYNNGATSFSEGLAAVDDGRNIYLDKTGKEVLDVRGHFAMEYAYSFSEGLAVFAERHNDLDYKGTYYEFGYIDKTGKEVIAPQYDGADSFSEGLAAVEEDGKYGFIDKTGKEVIALKYDSAHSFSEGLAAVEKDGKYGFIDKTGKEVVALKYDSAESISEGLALVKKEEKNEYVFIDKTGKEVIVVQVELGARSFSEGLALIDSSRFIDKTGKVVIELQEDHHALPFSEGLAAVEKDGQWGFIAKTPAVTQAASVTYKIANVTIDGVKQSFPQSAVVSSEGNSFVPMRAIFEKLGSTVKWDQKTNTAMAVKGMTNIKLTIGKTTATVNGKSVTLTAAAFTLNGNTMVPLRFVAEALGAKVGWNNSTQTVIITSAERLAGEGTTNTVD
ncbi:WG repeat-containing protein [Paenibacillus odorifer]|nr:WG repeat-containing protein [Paenibacillus odorifer]